MSGVLCQLSYGARCRNAPPATVIELQGAQARLPSGFLTPASWGRAVARLEPGTGVEPASAVYKTAALPVELPGPGFATLLACSREGRRPQPVQVVPEHFPIAERTGLVVDRCVRRMQRRCHLVWSLQRGNPLGRAAVDGVRAHYVRHERGRYPRAGVAGARANRVPAWAGLPPVVHHSAAGGLVIGPMATEEGRLPGGGGEGGIRTRGRLPCSRFRGEPIRPGSGTSPRVYVYAEGAGVEPATGHPAERFQGALTHRCQSLPGPSHSVTTTGSSSPA